MKMVRMDDISKLNLAGMTADSRAIKPGYLFAAIPGTQLDGRDFIPSALDKGATAILAPHDLDDSQLPEEIAIITDSNPRRRLAKLAAEFYQPQPSTAVAVTGTNGKSSVADFTRQLWMMLDKPAASIGTLGVVAPGHEGGYGLTTPDPVDLHKALHELQQEGVNHVAMEASSHGLDMYRLDGLSFKVAAFTNLTQDHLDYHGSMEIYRSSKLRLFDELLEKGGTAVVNTAAAEYDAIQNIGQERGFKILAYGINHGQIRCQDVKATGTGYDLILDIMGERFEIAFPLPGKFQIENALCALGMIMATGVEARKVAPLLANLQGVRGRLEKIGSFNGADIFVDFAHTPDALKTVLNTIRPHTENNLHVVFGCGGDRDRKKRPLMGKACLENADIAILTDDNPRSEDPTDIRADVTAECPNVVEIGGRATAIQMAVKSLKQGDILIVAGKGHEQGQIVGDKTLPFDDAEEVRKAIKLAEESL
ncbi:UDP-N-acetylmuramoyl-L-alanyl-D-glutamate--2,6-diaminopimelate ligase [Curvivirga aplysinae]|uniref:UDP-N-acetylmuramoyl-L-alanyl-D-glutamate--2, 6-diaminopimelate ligase n=1 Tax=Curvivirga aplysinae TaxID=2529852 RepID=UPI0012BBF1CC|nr:UDP-N-acetylmuramoyl-L-alanyl-D-glutamate--2,6-diaminopimelate ligase [Curvivirga aplysinae]MTI10786.1 UDP-N-acetylmuramoyl-L-alanyl-D-glutamate--2,6-diaminopimelate ligase [Curvivirga aplysinae]